MRAHRPQGRGNRHGAGGPEQGGAGPLDRRGHGRQRADPHPELVHLG